MRQLIPCVLCLILGITIGWQSTEARWFESFRSANSKPSEPQPAATTSEAASGASVLRTSADGGPFVSSGLAFAVNTQEAPILEADDVFAPPPPARLPPADSPINSGDSELTETITEPLPYDEPVGDAPTGLPSASLIAPESTELTESEQAVQKVVDAELAGLPAEERHIWFEQFRGLPAEVVRDILRVRQQLPKLSSLPADFPSADNRAPLLFNAPPPLALRDSLVNEPGIALPQRAAPPQSDSEFPPLQTSADYDLLEQIQAYNKANLESLGFRSLIPFWVDAVHTTGPAGREADQGTARHVTHLQGRKLALLRINLTAGQVITTGLPLDVCIAGHGWFATRTQEQLLLTKAGALKVLASGQLALAVCDTPLEPAVIIPADAHQLEIRPNGAVWGRRGTATPQVELGQIQLAKTTSDECLIPQGRSCYAIPSDRVMQMEFGQPGTNSFGQLRSGYLEGSNAQLGQAKPTTLHEHIEN